MLASTVHGHASSSTVRVLATLAVLAVAQVLAAGVVAPARAHASEATAPLAEPSVPAWYGPRGSQSAAESSCLLGSLLRALPVHPRIAIVNTMQFHLEVLAGLVDATYPFRNSTTFFVHPEALDTKKNGLNFPEIVTDVKCFMRVIPYEDIGYNWMDDHLTWKPPGSVRWKNPRPGASPYPAICPDSAGKRDAPGFDLMLFVSPEWNFTVVNKMINWGKPTQVIMMVHNGDTNHLNSLQKMAPHRFVTLAPHVSRFLRKRVKAPVPWILPLRHFVPRWKCPMDNFGGDNAGSNAATDVRLKEDPISSRSVSHVSACDSDSPVSAAVAACEQEYPTNVHGHVQCLLKLAYKHIGRMPATRRHHNMTGSILVASNGTTGHARNLSESISAVAPEAGIDRRLLTIKDKKIAHLHDKRRQAGGPCLSGFGIQGTFEKARRDYSSLWENLRLELMKDSSHAKNDRRLRIDCIGNGDINDLGVPAALDKFVDVYQGLPYLDYYNVMSHNLALVLAFNQDAYYDRKFSSTVLSSLMTGTPMIASKDLLKAYPFLNSNVVFIQGPKEKATDIMARVLNIPDEAIFERRRALRRLAAKLTSQASVKIAIWAVEALMAKSNNKTQSS